MHCTPHHILLSRYQASEAYERWSGMSHFGRGDGRGRGQQLPIP